MLARSPARRRAAECRGRAAEDQVEQSWRDRGFDILARRLRTGAGEIDLVVADPDTLIFVEVKARKTFADASYAVPPRQRARLLAAAGAALATNEDWQRDDTRFDVALVCGSTIHHVEDALRHG